MSTPIPRDNDSGISTRPVPGIPTAPVSTRPGKPRPSGTPVNQMTEEQRLKSQLDYFDREIGSINSRIQGIRNTISRLAPWQEHLRPQFEAQIAEEEKMIGALQGRRTESQNQYYQITGQYEKLLSGTERDAFMAVNALFKTYGLDTLAGKVFDYVKNGYSADTISVLLQDTKEYKERFAGNEERRKQGLPVLSPAEYLSVESSYRQVMESAGLPKGFYDTHQDMAKFIGKNISPSEMQTRVDLAVRANSLAPEPFRKALKQMGLSEGEMVSYWLDENKAMPILQKASATAGIGAEALAQGLSFDAGYAEGLAMAGVTAEQARKGYSAIAEEIGTLSTLGSIYGEAWGQREAERAMFEGAADVTQRRKRLASQERGQFGGAAGAARGGLSGRR